jgi:spoIIIJ-associated protein
MQFLTSNALKNADYAITRVNVDIADYKKQRSDRLRETAEEWMKSVKESGEEMSLEPMNPSDRRVIHSLASEYGLKTESEGFGRDRHIIIKT